MVVAIIDPLTGAAVGVGDGEGEGVEPFEFVGATVGTFEGRGVGVVILPGEATAKHANPVALTNSARILDGNDAHVAFEIA